MNISAIAFVFGIACCTAQPPDRPQGDGPSLVESLESYFTEPDRSARNKIAARIATMDGVDVSTIGVALSQLKLWKPHQPGFETLHVASGSHRGQPARVTDVTVAVPAGYDPDRAYPLLIALHDADTNGAAFAHSVAGLLGDRADEFIIAAPSDYPGVWLSSAQDDSTDLPDILLDLRHRFHVDTDRTYLIGLALGGHATFSASALYGDELAAAVSLDGTFVTQAGWDAVKLLLPNLRNVATLDVFAQPPDLTKDTSTSGLVTSNHYLAELARDLDVPIEFVPVNPADSAEHFASSRKRILETLSRKRPRAAKRVEHWFRYPAQGRCGWLRQTRFDGSPWTSQQIVVRPAIDETASEALTDVLGQRLAYLSGTVDGQTVRVETRKCDALDLLLSTELVDFDKPVTVYLDGTRRFEDRVTPSIPTLLELAYDDWDFQRLWPVRLQLTTKGQARQR